MANVIYDCVKDPWNSNVIPATDYIHVQSVGTYAGTWANVTVPAAANYDNYTRLFVSFDMEFDVGDLDGTRPIVIYDATTATTLTRVTGTPGANEYRVPPATAEVRWKLEMNVARCNDVLHFDYYSGGGSPVRANKYNDIANSASITAGTNIILPATSSTVGNITQGGNRLLHTYGTYNINLGILAGNYTTSGTGYNINIGYQTGGKITTGSRNINIGRSAGGDLTEATYCVNIGDQAGWKITTGGMNVNIGTQTGQTIITGQYNTCIGEFTDVDAANAYLRTVIGYGATNLNDNSIRLGRFNTDQTYLKGPTADSDRRLKREIRNIPVGLKFLLDLRPVGFKWKNRTFHNGETVKYKREHFGLIAQELKEIIDKHGFDFGGYDDYGYNNKCKGKEKEINFNDFIPPNDLKGIEYTQLIPILIKAVQELSEKIDKLEGKKI